MAANYFSNLRMPAKTSYRGGGDTILNPSKEASAFTDKYETKFVPTSSDTDRGVVPLTKVEITPSDSTTNPKHIYVNVAAQNTNRLLGIPAQFQIDFDQPYLKNAEKYYLTIVKAVFPTTSIPFFEFIGGKYYITIQYPPDGFSVLIPVIPIGIPTSVIDGNYFVYYYEQFIDSINQAFLTAFLQLKSAPGSTFAGNLPPFIVYEKPSNRFVLVAEQGYWKPDSDTGAILSMDFTTFRLFNSLPFINIDTTPPTDFQLSIENMGLQASDSSATNVCLSGNMNKNIERFWSQFHIYSRGMVVFFNGVYYACIANNTVGPQPDLFPLSWQPQGVTNPNIWAVGTTYVASQIVYYPTANSVPFVSLVYPNVGNVPNPAAATAILQHGLQQELIA